MGWPLSQRCVALHAGLSSFSPAGRGWSGGLWSPGFQKPDLGHPAVFLPEGGIEFSPGWSPPTRTQPWESAPQNAAVPEGRRECNAVAGFMPGPGDPQSGESKRVHRMCAGESRSAPPGRRHSLAAVFPALRCAPRWAKFVISLRERVARRFVVSQVRKAESGAPGVPRFRPPAPVQSSSDDSLVL